MSKLEIMSAKDKKKGALVPRLRFPEFRDAGEWEGTTIGKICKCYSGGTPNTTHREFYGGNIPFIRSAEIGKNSTELFLSELGVRHSSTKLVKRGAVLVALYGANSGEVAISPIKGAINQAILCLESDQNNVFLYNHILNIQKFIIVKYIQGGQGNLSAEIIKSIQLYLPDMPEQQRIADCLSSLDERIAAETSKLDRLKDHKKGLLKQLFPAEGETLPQLRFPEFRDAGEWGQAPLGYLLLSQPDYGINAPAVPYTSSLPTYIRITDISEEGQFIAEKKASVDVVATPENCLHPGDIVLARTGASVGKAYKYNENDGKLVFAGFLIRIKPNWRKINSNFLFNFLFTKRYWDWVAFTSPRSGQPGINSAEYATLPVPTPPSDGDVQPEQQKIAGCLSSLDELITAQTQKIDLLKTHKKGLMQQLFPVIDEAKA